MSAAQILPTVSVIIPAHNEAVNLRRTLPFLLDFTPVRFAEIVVVDDGSSDETARVVEGFALKDARVRLVQFPRNRGKGAAVKAGLLAATSEVLFYTDADLIYQLHDLPTWVELLRSADIVNGNRRLPDSVFNVPTRYFPYVVKRARLGLIFNAFVRRVLPVGTTDTQSGLKLFRREAAHRLARATVENHFAFDVELFAWAARFGCRIAEVPVRLDYRDEVTRVKLLRDGWQMFLAVWAIRRRVRRAGNPRIVLVTADDFGLSAKVSTGIIEACRHGAVKAVSVMTNFPDTVVTLPALRAVSEVAIGVHLSATAGAPLTTEGRFLAKRSGRFSRREFLWRYLTSPRRTVMGLRAEWTAQIEALRAAGVTPAHLDSHHHVHLLPGLQRCVLDLALRFNIPRVRASHDPAFLRSPATVCIYLLARFFARRARRHRLLVADHFRGNLLMRARDKQAALERIMRSLPGGMTEIYCHPGYADPDLNDPYREGRAAELAALGACRDNSIFGDAI
ncbi:MAG: ChbG/HpnK family deacetylase [Deltaproteobacteria bacterium]|nr:ChbG/HpnK family deacetylase [Deltaproteobacteria bacterium]